MPRRVRLGPLAQVPENGNRAFEVGDASVLVSRSAGQVFATSNQCTHAQSVLEGGRVRQCYLFCPLHGERFDLRDGKPAGTLASIPLHVYPVHIEDGEIVIELGDELSC